MNFTKPNETSFYFKLLFNKFEEQVETFKSLSYNNLLRYFDINQIHFFTTIETLLKHLGLEELKNLKEGYVGTDAKLFKYYNYDATILLKDFTFSP